MLSGIQFIFQRAVTLFDEFFDRTTMRIATMNITGRRTTATGGLTVHTRKLRTGREQP